MLDQYDPHPSEGWPQWMRREIAAATHVLVVCTETYLRQVDLREAPGRGLGATWEGSLVTLASYAGQGFNEKFIPVVFSAADRAFVPDFLRGVTCYDVSTGTGYEALYARLTGQKLVPVPPLGVRRKVRMVSNAEEAPPPHAKGRRGAFWTTLGMLCLLLLAIGLWYSRREEADKAREAPAPADSAPVGSSPDPEQPPRDTAAPATPRERIQEGETATRSFLPIPTYHVQPIRTTDWFQTREWTIFYRHGLYFGNENADHASPCTPDVRLVGEWDWTGASAAPARCIDDQWLSVDVSALAEQGRLRNPTPVNITNADQTAWGLHGNTRFLAPCLLSEVGSDNLWIQATSSGVRLVRATTPTPWIAQNPDLDVCQRRNVAVVPNPKGRPFIPRETTR